MVNAGRVCCIHIAGYNQVGANGKYRGAIRALSFSGIHHSDVAGISFAAQKSLTVCPGRMDWRFFHIKTSELQLLSCYFPG